MIEGLLVADAATRQGVGVDTIYRAIKSDKPAELRRLGIVAVTDSPEGQRVTIDPALPVVRRRRVRPATAEATTGAVDVRIAQLESELAATRATLTAVQTELELRRAEIPALHALLADALKGRGR